MRGLFFMLVNMGGVAMSANRDKNGRFLPGNSGGGRPKIPDDVRKIFKAATTDAANKLVSLLSSKNEKIAFMAAQEILNRTLGKPETSGKLEISGVNNEAIIFKWQDTESNTQKTQAMTI